MEEQGAHERDEYVSRLELLMKKCLEQMAAVGVHPCRKIFRIEENRRAKKRLGCCRTVREAGRNGFVIEVSSAMRDCPDDILKNVIFHELLHTCEGCMNHGQKWKLLADLINRTYGHNIQVRADAGQVPGLAGEAEGQKAYRYEIRCGKCGAVFYRIRRSRVVEHPENYRCSACGGRLLVQKL